MKTIRQRMLIIALMLPAVLMALPLSADEGSSWYIGFGIGSGAAWGDGEYFFNEGADTIALPLVLNFGAGARLSRKLFLGFDYISFSHFARVNTPAGRESRVLSIDDFYAAIIFFPAGERFFLKLAAGLTYLGDWDYDFFSSRADFYAGPGGTAGAGAFFPLSGNMKLGLHAEYSYHRYSGGPFDRTDMALVYVSLYWF